ncbi:hypothetical protein TGRUB_305630B, partial [Toxoplasma gondii RUB]
FFFSSSSFSSSSFSSSGCTSVRGRSSASAASSPASCGGERGFSVELLATFRTPSTAYFADLLDNQLLGIWTATAQDCERQQRTSLLSFAASAFPFFSTAAVASLFSSRANNSLARRPDADGGPLQTLEARDDSGGSALNAQLLSDCSPSVLAIGPRSVGTLAVPGASPPFVSPAGASAERLGSTKGVSRGSNLIRRPLGPPFPRHSVSPVCGFRSLFDVLPLALASRQRRNQASPRRERKEMPAAPSPKAAFAFSRALASSPVAASSLSSLSSFFSAASLSSLSTRPSLSRASPSSVGCSSLNSSLSEQRTSPERNNVVDSQLHSPSLSSLPRSSSFHPSSLPHSSSSFSHPSSLSSLSSLSPLSSRGSSAGEPLCAGPSSPALQSESLAAPPDPRSGVRPPQERTRLQHRGAADSMQNLPAPCMQLRRKADAWSLLDWRGLCVDERGELEIRTFCPIASIREEDRLMTRPFSALVRQRRREQAEKAASRGYT